MKSEQARNATVLHRNKRDRHKAISPEAPIFDPHFGA